MTVVAAWPPGSMDAREYSTLEPRSGKFLRGVSVSVALSPTPTRSTFDGSVILTIVPALPAHYENLVARHRAHAHQTADAMRITPSTPTQAKFMANVGMRAYRPSQTKTETAQAR